jgi:hypothetical protein
MRSIRAKHRGTEERRNRGTEDGDAISTARREAAGLSDTIRVKTNRPTSHPTRFHADRVAQPLGPATPGDAVESRPVPRFLYFSVSPFLFVIPFAPWPPLQPPFKEIAALDERTNLPVDHAALQHPEAAIGVDVAQAVSHGFDDALDARGD